MPKSSPCFLFWPGLTKPWYQQRWHWAERVCYLILLFFMLVGKPKRAKFLDLKWKEQPAIQFVALDESARISQEAIDKFRKESEEAYQQYFYHIYNGGYYL